MWRKGSPKCIKITRIVTGHEQEWPKMPHLRHSRKKIQKCHQNSRTDCSILGSFYRKFAIRKPCKKQIFPKSFPNQFFVISGAFRGRRGGHFWHLFLNTSDFCEKGWHRESDGIYKEFEGFAKARASRKATSGRKKGLRNLVFFR